MPGSNGQTRLLDADGRPFRLGYDAVEDKKRRRPPRFTLKSEDKHLDTSDRKKLIATSRDLVRNYAIASWLCRMHLSNVAEFQFQARTGNPALDSQLEQLVRWWGRPLNFDVAGRHGLRRYIRLAEQRRLLDGDFGTLKLSSGLVQGIEGDRIRTPRYSDAQVDLDRTTHGIVTSKAGRARAYCLHNRRKLGDGFEFDRVVPARHMQWHGYYDRIDQVRGISPVASAVNTLQDTYECLSYGVLKAKVSQIFGVVWKRTEESEESAGDVTSSNDSEGNLDKSATEVDFGRGPFSTDLEPDEDVDIVESQQPSQQFQDFMKVLIMVALKSVDLPYSWFDSKGASWSSHRSEWVLYDRAAENRRSENRDHVNALLAWRIGLWVLDGELVLPKSVSIDDLAWEWVSVRMPWVDPQKEAAGWAIALEEKLTSHQRICAARGEDWWEIADELADEKAYLDQKGLADAQQKPAAARQNQYVARLGDYRYALPC